MAGFMRLLSEWFTKKWENRLINIHPSLLPNFKGLNAQQQALDAKVKEAGCTVHFVTKEMDAGPIIIQKKVKVLPDDNLTSLSSRILKQEHIAYVEALEKVAKQYLNCENK
jgi:phosphoribosylglycinamide formyltransferase-1